MHPDAAASFNSRANSLLSRVHSRLPEERPRRPFSPDLHVAAHLGPEAIRGAFRSALIDVGGQELARYFVEGSVEVGLDGSDYQELVALIESVSKSAPFRNAVSRARLMDAALDWMHDSRRLATDLPVTDYMVRACMPEVRQFEVAVPIAMLSVQCAVPVGRAEIRPITKLTIAEWFEPIRRRAETDNERRAADEYVARKVKELGGYAAAFVSVNAEPKRASEIAIEEAATAAALLRFGAIASFTPRVTSCCLPLGQQLIPGSETYLFHAGSLQQSTDGFRQRYSPHWILSAEEIAHMRSAFLDALSGMFSCPATDLHKRIVDGVLLFSRVSIAHELTEKLVLLFSSLEFLFLRNASEPVQSSLAERLALLVGRDLEERKRIVALTKRAYAMRSRFVHHAHSIEDVSTTQERGSCATPRAARGSALNRRRCAEAQACPPSR